MKNEQLFPYMNGVNSCEAVFVFNLFFQVGSLIVVLLNIIIPNCIFVSSRIQHNKIKLYNIVSHRSCLFTSTAQENAECSVEENLLRQVIISDEHNTSIFTLSVNKSQCV